MSHMWYTASCMCHVPPHGRHGAPVKALMLLVLCCAPHLCSSVMEMVTDLPNLGVLVRDELGKMAKTNIEQFNAITKCCQAKSPGDPPQIAWRFSVNPTWLD